MQLQTWFGNCGKYCLQQHRHIALYDNFRTTLTVRTYSYIIEKEFTKMGFHDVKKRVIQCLLQGIYDHEVRRNIDIKNLFQCGQLSEADVIGLILHTSGNDYEVRPHHKAPSVDVHILKPCWAGQRWYVKFYFVEPDVVFISVHQSGG